MNENLRPAREADLGAVAAIETSWPSAPGWSRAQFASELGRGESLFLVAEDAGGVAGYLVCRVVPPEARLLTIAVAKSRARRGLGLRLVAGLAAEARRRGLETVTLEVSAANEPAQRLYRAAGFSVVGRRPKFYNDGSDAILMDLPL